MEIGSSEWKNVIVEGAGRLGISVRSHQADLFAVHALMLDKWNQKINLSAIHSPLDMAVKHYLDAIAPLHFVRQGRHVLDVGSGAGFPGIPLKVMIPSLHVTLVDATRKKVSFLKHVIRELGLTDISAVHARVENLPEALEGSFDVIVSRAFSSLADIAEKSLPFLAPEGEIIAYKGRDAAVDIQQAAITQDNGSTIFVPEGNHSRRLQMQTLTFTLPFLDLNRTLIILRR